MRELRTEIEIDARPESVWEILVDFAKYPEWNPFIKSISGEASEGSRLKVRIEPDGGKAMTFEPKVVAVDVNKKFAWKGKVLMSGIFDGQHEFILERLADGKTRFVHREEFSGILVPIIWPMLEAKTKRGFTQMNEALKKRARGN
jgi:hypothetical protein